MSVASEVTSRGGRARWGTRGLRELRCRVLCSPAWGNPSTPDRQSVASQDPTRWTWVV